MAANFKEREVVMMIEQTNHLFLRRFEGSSRLIIAFSHVDYPIGKFAMTNVLNPNELESSILHVNCGDNAWYQEGIEGNVNSIDKLKDTLGAILEHLKPSYTLTVGMSMGGYAATLFGLLLRVDNIVAFTPEILIGRPQCRSITLNRRKFFDWRYSDLSYLLTLNKSTIVNAIYGAYDIIDLSLLSSVIHLMNDTDHQNRFTFCSEAHQVPEALEVGNIVRCALALGLLAPDQIRRSLVRRTVHNASEMFAISRAVEHQIRNEFEVAIDVLTSDVEFKSTSWMNMFVAENFRKLGKVEEAISWFSAALERDPHSFFLHFRLAQYAEESKLYDVAKSSIANALEINPRNKHAISLHQRVEER